jgi:hypothetical protein
LDDAELGSIVVQTIAAVVRYPLDVRRLRDFELASFCAFSMTARHGLRPGMSMGDGLGNTAPVNTGPIPATKRFRKIGATLISE